MTEQNDRETLNLMERRLREAEALSEIAMVVSESLDTSHIVEVALDKIEDLIPNDASIVQLIDKEHGILLGVSHRGRARDCWGPGKSPIPLGVAARGRVALTGVPFVCDDFADHPLSLSKATCHTFHPFCIVPVRAGNDTLGIIAATRVTHQPFSESEVDLLIKIGIQMGMALRNARLYEEVNEAYKRLKDTQDQLVQAEKLSALGRMAAGVAHDFNNILAGIVSNVELLLQDATGVNRQRLETIKQTAMDGAESVRRIQEFTRLRRDESFTDVDLNEVARDVIEITRPQWSDEARRRGGMISMRLECGDIPAVSGNPAELRQALMNIVLNAVDAVSPGGEIIVSSDLFWDRVRLEVKDNGPGISEEAMNHIFDPFYSTKGSRGSGLGLSIAQAIVQRHHGEVVVKSAPGEGASFRIMLPPALGTMPVQTEHRRKQCTRGARILLVDDETIVRESIGMILESQGYSVTLAHLGKNALDHLTSASFDILITDLGMPDIPGNKLATEARAVNPSLPVILLTGWGAQLTVDSPEARAVSRVLTKPIETDELVRAIEELIQKAPETRQK